MYRAYYDNKNIYVLQYQNNKVISYVSFPREEKYTKDIKETLNKYNFVKLNDSYIKRRMPSSLSYLFWEGNETYDYIDFYYKNAIKTANLLSAYIDWRSIYEKLSKLLIYIESLVPGINYPPYEISDFEDILEQFSICVCLEDKLIKSCFDMEETLLGARYGLNGMLR